MVTMVSLDPDLNPSLNQVSLCFLHLPPTVQTHADQGQFNWRLSIVLKCDGELE